MSSMILPSARVAGRLLAAVAVLLALLAVAAPVAHADTDKATKAARKHYDKGEKLFALGRFDEALEAYEAAFEAKPLPGFLFNIGQCHRNLGDVDAAIFSYRKYLKLAPDADNREAVEELIAELEEEKRAAEEERRKVQVADLSNDGDPPPRRDDGGGAALYKKWWFWGGIAAVAGAGAGGYFLLRDTGVPDTDLGNVVWR